MKLLFLLRHESGFWKGSYFKFRAYKYRPFSWDVQRDTQELERRGIINVKRTRIGRDRLFECEKVLYTYTLTPKGKTLIPELLVDFPPSLM